jgi:non-ribosomal peptide synthetase component F
LALSSALSERVRALGRAERSTAFVTLLAAFKALLHGYSGQTDVVVGSPVACRTRTELEDLIGYFVNVLPFRTDLGGDPTLRELIGRVDASVAEVHAHQELPFAKLVEELRPPRTGGGNPIYQVEFTLLSYEHAPAVYNYGFRSAVSVAHEIAGGLVLTPLEVESGVSKFDLVVLLWDVPAGISGTFEYDAERFDAATIAELAARFQRLLEIAVERPDLHLGELGQRLAPAPRASAVARAAGPGQARRRRVASEGPAEGGHG